MTEDDQIDLSKIKHYHAEYATTGNIRFPDTSSVKIYDADGNESVILCKCGKEATTIIMGKETFMGICSECQHGKEPPK